MLLENIYSNLPVNLSDFMSHSITLFSLISRLALGAYGALDA